MRKDTLAPPGRLRDLRPEYWHYPGLIPLHIVCVQGATSKYTRQIVQIAPRWLCIRPLRNRAQEVPPVLTPNLSSPQDLPIHSRNAGLPRWQVLGWGCPRCAHLLGSKMLLARARRPSPDPPPRAGRPSPPEAVSLPPPPSLHTCAGLVSDFQGRH